MKNLWHVFPAHMIGKESTVKEALTGNRVESVEFFVSGEDEVWLRLRFENEYELQIGSAVLVHPQPPN